MGETVIPTKDPSFGVFGGFGFLQSYWPRSNVRTGAWGS